MLRFASHYLDPRSHSQRKTITIREADVEEQREITKAITEILEKEGVSTKQPRYRTECPTVRPCPFIGCQYNLWADVTDTGTLKLNYHPIEPWEMKNSCVLDIAESNPEGATLLEVGKHMQLTRERVRQIEADALRKLDNFIRESEDFKSIIPEGQE